MTKTQRLIGFSVVAFFSTTPAFAAAPKIDSGDTAWMLTSSLLVLMMTIPGLALFYCRHGAKEERARDPG